MGACISAVNKNREHGKEEGDGKTAVTNGSMRVLSVEEEFPHRVTREDSLIHLTRHPRFHAFAAADRFGLNGSFENIKILGRGGTGVTWLCKDKKHDDKLVAIKLQQRPIPENSVPMTYNEIVVQGSEGPGCIFTTTIQELVITPSHIGLVLEYENGGTMAEYVAERVGSLGPLELAVSEDQARYFFRQLVAGLGYLHRHHTAHRDVKLDNTLLNSPSPGQPPVVKLADFQFCYFWGPSENIRSTSHLGTPVYMSPELLQVRFQSGAHPHSYDPATADTWACAVWLVALLTGAFPFDNRPGASTKEAEQQILKQQMERRWHESRHIKPYVSKLSSACLDLLNRMLVVDPATRISLAGVQCHQWLTAPLPPNLESAWKRLEAEQKRILKQTESLQIDRSLVKARDDIVWDLVNEASREPPKSVSSSDKAIKASGKKKYSFVDGDSIPGGWRIDMRLAAVAVQPEESDGVPMEQKPTLSPELPHSVEVS